MDSRVGVGTATTGRRRRPGRIPGPPVWQLPKLAVTGPHRPHELAAELHRRYGDVVRLGVGRAAYVYLFGEQANRQVLVDQVHSFTWAEAVKPLEPVVGPTALILSDGDEHRRRRRFVQPAFATRRIDAAVPVVVEEVDRLIDELPMGVAVDLHARYRSAARRIVVRVLFGDAPAGLADELGEALEPAVAFVDRTVELQRVDPLGSRRARRARHRADDLVDAEVARRRSTGELGADVLGSLLATELTEEEIRDQVVSLIAAGYETTSAVIAWLVLALLTHPDELARCQAEIDGALGTSPPEPEVLRALPAVTAAINETLRLWPPASLLGRRLTTSLSFTGHEVPAGTTVLISPYVTQRSEASWAPDPAAFRPSRWAGLEVPEERFFPFGSPYRRCIGFSLAFTEIQVGIIRLLQRATIRATQSTLPRGHGLSALRPDGGAPVVVDHRR